MNAARPFTSPVLHAGWALAALTLVSIAFAHHAPPSYFRFDFRADRVEVQLMLPASELGYAISSPPSADSLRTYLNEHVGARTPQGDAWTLRVKSVERTTYLGQVYWSAHVEMQPPARASPRNFLFHSDAITHEVRNHRIMLVAERDHADPTMAPVFIGALQYPASEIAVSQPLRRQAAEPATSRVVQ